MLTGKRRTRQHIIADLSVNHIERFILQTGDVAQRVLFDYGYDLFVHTFSEQGDYEPGYYLIQLKATDAPSLVEKADAFALVLSCRDLMIWLAEKSPVFLVLYDAQREIGYWCHVGQELTGLQSSRPDSETVTVHISRNQIVNSEAAMTFRQRKNDQLQQERGQDDTNH